MMAIAETIKTPVTRTMKLVLTSEQIWNENEWKLQARAERPTT
jgi:hypothetical protein